MTRPSATCELWLDGQRVADTGDDLEVGAVTALSSLQLTWGRDGTQEQPGPATLAFELVDPVGWDSVLDVVHVGSAVEVWATGAVETPINASNSYDDGTFSTKADGWVPSSDATAVGPTATIPYVWYSGHTLGLSAKGYTAGATHGVRVPTRSFSPTSELPNAWDDMPRARVGETWTFRLDAMVPTGYQLHVQPIFYTTPYPNGVLGSGNTTGELLATGTGAWASYTFTVLINRLGAAGSPVESVWPAMFLKMEGDPSVGRAWRDQGTKTWLTAPSTWNNFPLYGIDLTYDNLEIYSPPVTTRRVLSFSGAVSDFTASPAGNGGLSLSVNAADIAADLGNRVIGDTPWDTQDLAVRANRIMTLAGLSASQLLIDAPLGQLDVAYRDVDAQPAYALLQDLAQSAGGVLWAATHATTGPYLWLENLDNRAAVSQMVEDNGQVVIVGNANYRLLSACDVLEESVTWRQSTEDVSTVVSVTWQEYPGADNLPTLGEHTYTATDTDGLALYGTRRLSIATELVKEGDAADVATRALRYARGAGWRLDGVVQDTATLLDTIPSVDDGTRQATLLALLDGTTRMGAPITLMDMPDYSPTGAVSSLYVEGGRYRYGDGFWSLELTTTPSTGLGRSATWREVEYAHPAWNWTQFDHLWGEMYGVNV